MASINRSLLFMVIFINWFGGKLINNKRLMPTINQKSLYVYTRSTGLEITELNLFHIVHMSMFSYFLMYKKYNIQREKGQIQGFNKKTNRAEKVHKNVCQALRGKKLKSVLIDKWPEGGETGLGQLAVLSQAATFCLVLFFLRKYERRE